MMMQSNRLAKRLGELEQRQQRRQQGEKKPFDFLEYAEMLIEIQRKDAEQLREYFTPWQLAAMETIPDTITADVPLGERFGLLNEYQHIAMQDSKKQQAWLGTTNELRGYYSNYVKEDVYHTKVDSDNYTNNSLAVLSYQCSKNEERQAFREKYPHLFKHDEEMTEIFRVVLPHKYPDMHLPYELRQHYTVEDADYSLYASHGKPQR